MNKCYNCGINLRMRCSMEIIKCKTDDLEAIQKISRETFYDTFKDTASAEDMSLFLDKNYALDKLKKEFENPNSEFYFLMDRDKVAGYLKLNSDEAQTENIADNSFELERIYLDKDYKFRGLGSVLFDFAESKARDLNKSSIWLGVWEHNKPALSLYTKKGLEVVGSHPYNIENEPQTDLIMLKKL